MEINNIFTATDGAIVEGALRREEKRDLGELVQLANHYLSKGNWKMAIQVQFTMITAMANTIVKLEKRNLLMDKDYKRGRK